MQAAQKWIFWQVVPSPHLAPFFRELARKLGSSGVVHCVFERPVPQERLDLGWALPDYGDALVVIQPEPAEVEALLDARDSRTHHFFSGLVMSRWLRDCYKHASSNPGVCGIITESRDNRGLKGLLRGLHSQVIERSWRASSSMVFAMGGQGVSWLAAIGYSPTILFPFAYVVDLPTRTMPHTGKRDCVKFVFVGKLEPRKNVGLLLKTFLGKDFEQCELVIVGDGPDRRVLEKRVADSPWATRVQFSGALPNESVRTVLCNADCLVLPSHYDGWGAVVNEALMAGTRVIVSDRCGAADVVEKGYNGFVFKAGDLRSLLSAMLRILDMGVIDPATRQELVASAEVLSPSLLADYFLDVVRYVEDGQEGPRPQPPWRNRQGRHASALMAPLDKRLATDS